MNTSTDSEGNQTILCEFIMEHHQLHQQQDPRDDAAHGMSALAAVHPFQQQQPQQHARIQPPINYNLQQIEREILNYPALAHEQQFPVHGIQTHHAENYEHHHQHEHEVFHSETLLGQHQNHASQAAVPTTIKEVTYQTYPSSVYETAIEAAKPSYNMMPFDGNANDAIQNNDAVNALIGEYFGQNSEAKEDDQLTAAHDHSHAHTEHAVLTDARASDNLNSIHEPAPVHGFNYVQPPDIQQIQPNIQANPRQQPQPNFSSEEKQSTSTIQLATTGIQHPVLPPMTTTFAETATDLISTTTRDNIDGIRARREMNAILKEQSDADIAVRHAEEEFERAKEALEKAKADKVRMEEKVCTIANTLVDSLLKENTRWNNMYAKLVRFKEKEGHCDVMRNPYRSSTKRVKRDKESMEQNELISLGTWVGQNRYVQHLSLQMMWNFFLNLCLNSFLHTLDWKRAGLMATPNA
jgi:hypothetical protein